jgi:hypothetical protein
MDLACLGLCTRCERRVCELCIDERGHIDDECLGVSVVCCHDCAGRDAPKDGASLRWRVVNGTETELLEDSDSDRTLDSGVSSSSSASEAGEDPSNDVDGSGCNNREGGTRSTMPAKNADGTLWLNRRSGKMHLGHSRSHDRSACGCHKGDHYILLDMAEALCEAKWDDQGILAKCISCFGLNGDFADVGVDVGSARSRIALAFECDDDTVLADLLASAC